MNDVARTTSSYSIVVISHNIGHKLVWMKFFITVVKADKWSIGSHQGLSDIIFSCITGLFRYSCSWLNLQEVRGACRHHDCGSKKRIKYLFHDHQKVKLTPAENVRACGYTPLSIPREVPPDDISGSKPWYEVSVNKFSALRYTRNLLIRALRVRV